MSAGDSYLTASVPRANAKLSVLPTKQQYLDRAGCWLLESGIQDSSGGCARYYRADLREYARVSTEITGYAISALGYLYERRGDAGYLAGASRAGDFLIRSAWSEALRTFPFEQSSNGDVSRARAYFFDLGIIVRGLLVLHRLTGDGRYLDVAAKAGEQMRGDFPAPGGFHPILELPDKHAAPYAEHWSKAPGCYQLKSAMSWKDLSAATGDRRFGEYYHDALGYALGTHEGFLPAPGAPENTVDRLHAYCYFLEGLLPAAAEHAGVLESGIERVSHYLQSLRPQFERSDVYAQLLRLRVYAEALAGIPVNENEAAAEFARVLEFQIEDSDARRCGGWNFGTRQGQPTAFVNPVSTVFCMQAAAIWEDRARGLPPPPAASLI